MIVPIQTGRSIMPVYIPTPTPTTTNTIQTYDDNVSAPVEQNTNPWFWALLIVIGIIAVILYCLFIKVLYDLVEGDE